MRQSTPVQIINADVLTTSFSEQSHTSDSIGILPTLLGDLRNTILSQITEAVA